MNSSIKYRKCSVCNQEKELEENFHKSRCQPLGYTHRCKVCCSIARKEYYSVNKEKENKRNNAWYAENTEKKKTKGYEWVKNNKQVSNQIYNKWHKNKKKVDNLFRVRKLLSANIKAAILKQRFSKRVEKIIGCDYLTFVGKIGTQPAKEYTLDHICPLTQAQNEEELLKLYHYTNCQWLTMEENYKKFNYKTEKGEELCKNLLGREWIEIKNGKR